jgi:hypothetical protein
MAGERLDKHDKIHHELFDEDTSQIGSLGDIVEKHDGDAVFLGQSQKGIGGADGGEADFEEEMNESDPAPHERMDPDDLFSARDENGVFATDQTGTVQGIARGFGTHLPQDIGRGGFQVEEIPDKALQYALPVADGEELDDYDDDDDGSGKFDQDADLSRASQPGVNRIAEDNVGGLGDEPTPDRIPVRERHPRDTDDELDATRLIK